MANRLANETSPYLLQHAHNPVDWFPWGADALETARKEDKPILLSIGYAACHWCHVMERESFEDAETARVMNDLFVNVKVDREERPDLDSIYMNAVQSMTGHGGWPMTMFCTPDGKPFYGGTYYPPEPRQGMPSFRDVLEAVHDAWVKRREEIERQGEELVEHISRTTTLRATADPMTESTLNRAAQTLLQHVDAEWGGFGEGMKFPSAPVLEFLLRMHVVHGSPGALEDVTLTLDRMARGGIFDQIGGGFHRYAVDRIWLVPHFEKMLYDNAQLIRLYARAWQVTGSALYRETAIATGKWMLREMQHERGGFYSSLDADSEGVEGKFYVWPFDELIAAAGDDMPATVAYFAAAGHGNWEGANILWRPHTDGEVASQTGMSIDELHAAIARVKPKLLGARARRVRPGTDDKVLASWNGLAIAGLAEAGRVLHRADFVAAAQRAARFVWDEMRPGGRLARSWRDGVVSGTRGFLDDHANMADAMLTLYETDHDVEWYERASSLARAMLDLFSDAGGGGFFDTGSDADRIVVRPKDLFDNAMPSGNSSAADVLLRLAALGGDVELERAGVSFLRTIHEAMVHSPSGFGTALGALDRYLSRAVEIAIVGSPAAPFLDVVRARYLPNAVVAVGTGDTPALLSGREAAEGTATAFVCRDFACKLPVTEPGELDALLPR
ncbi:MAG: thioredoxin domain-containing protein [Actinobacteria bacterium]|nr:thioredoxin domain-containing protein [Actinomycetota bacterium]